MQSKIVSNYTNEDEVIKLLNPKVGYVSVSGIIGNHDQNRAEVILNDGRIGYIAITEFYPNKKFNSGEKYIFLILNDGNNPILSVSHPNLLISIIEGISPELRNGDVLEFDLVRRVGIRSKISVASTVTGLDPVGAFVGKAANRIKYLMSKVGNERIDIVPYHNIRENYVINSLGVKVDKIEEVDGVFNVYVPNHQLRAALGGGGINVSLASKLTRERIKIFGER